MLGQAAVHMSWGIPPPPPQHVPPKEKKKQHKVATVAADANKPTTETNEAASLVECRLEQ